MFADTCLGLAETTIEENVQEEEGEEEEEEEGEYEERGDGEN